MKIPVPLIAAAVYLLSCIPGSAAVLVNYSFTGLNGTPTTTGSDLTASNLQGGAGVTLAYVNAWDGGAAAISNVVSTTEAASFTANDYVEFTLTPTSGFEMDLSSLTFQLARANTSAPNRVFVRSSLDSYTTTIFASTSSPTTTPPPPQSINVDLSGASFQNLNSAVTFRIYAYTGGGSSTSSSSQLRMDNVTVNGTTVPEPNAFVLGGMGLFLVLVRRPRGLWRRE